MITDTFLIFKTATSWELLLPDDHDAALKNKKKEWDRKKCLSCNFRGSMTLLRRWVFPTGSSDVSGPGEFYGTDLLNQYSTFKKRCLDCE